MKKNKKLIRDNLQFIDSALANDATYYDYLHRMKKIAVSMFEWVNLPESMDARFLEECLYYFGEAALLYDEKYGFINTKCCSNGDLNIYGLPTKLNCYAYSNVFNTDRTLYTGLKSDTEEKDTKQCVLVLNSLDRYSSIRPLSTTIEGFAYRLYEAQRTCDINIKSQRFPVLLLGTDKQKLMLENLYNQYNGNQPVIYGDKDQISNDMFKVIDTKSPYVVDKITEYKKEIWNEFLSYIGVNNVEVNKKERLISGEASSNNEYINYNLESYLEPRKHACKQFNDLFGLTGTDKEISVRIRSDLNNIIKANESIVADYKDDGLINGSEGDNNE